MTRRSRTLTTTRRTASPADQPETLTDHPESPADLVPMAVLVLVPFAGTLAVAYPTLAAVALSALAGAAAHRSYTRRKRARTRPRPHPTRQ